MKLFTKLFRGLWKLNPFRTYYTIEVENGRYQTYEHSMLNRSFLAMYLTLDEAKVGIAKYKAKNAPNIKYKVELYD